MQNHTKTEKTQIIHNACHFFTFLDPTSKSVYVRSTMKGGSILRLLGVWADLGGANKGFTAPSYSSQKSSCFLGGSLGGFGGRLVARSLSSPQPPQFQYVQCLSLDNEVSRAHNTTSRSCSFNKLLFDQDKLPWSFVTK